MELTKKLKNITATLAIALLAALCCIGLTACGDNTNGSTAAGKAHPTEIYSGCSVRHYDAVPGVGYYMNESTNETLYLYADGTYSLTVIFTSIHDGDSTPTTMTHTTVEGEYTASAVDADTGYKTIKLINSKRVYAGGGMGGSDSWGEGMKGLVWSDDASLTATEKENLMTVFKIENLELEVNVDDNTLDYHDFGMAYTAGLIMGVGGQMTPPQQ